MKKTAIEDEGTRPQWDDALALFEADLRHRGAAEKTRRAYAVDLGQLAVWASRAGLTPEALTAKDLRRYAAHLGNTARPAAATLARKLAAQRSFFRVLREHGRIAHNPADLLPAPKKPGKLPRTLKPSEVAALLDRIHRVHRAGGDVPALIDHVTRDQGLPTDNPARSLDYRLSDTMPALPRTDGQSYEPSTTAIPPPPPAWPSRPTLPPGITPPR